MRKAAMGFLVCVLFLGTAVSVAAALPPGGGPDGQGIERASEVSHAVSIEDGQLVLPNQSAGGQPSLPQPKESELTKIVFIRYAPDRLPAKVSCDGDGVCESGENASCADCKGTDEAVKTTCYAFLSGAKPKWPQAEPYLASSALLKSVSDVATSTWEAPVRKDIFLGTATIGSAPWGQYDFINSVSFGDYSEDGVLGVTALWYLSKTIYEYDIMLDTDFFPGGQEVAGSYDLNTVVLHEFGHAAGLGDLYDSACGNQVMYGYLDAGEVKLVLQSGDIKGITTLYGVK